MHSVNYKTVVGRVKGVAAQIVLVALWLVLLGQGTVVYAEPSPGVWEALKSGGHAALLRHALAPGTGDPPNFQVGDCETQRNLSAQGREQAKRIGSLFRDNGIRKARVYTSQWCRCRETAELLGLGPVEELPSLNSFFQDFARRDAQTQKTLQWIAEQTLDGPMVLVTHQVNITALTGIFPASGELVVVRRSDDGSLAVVGTIETR